MVVFKSKVLWSFVFYINGCKWCGKLVCWCLGNGGGSIGDYINDNVDEIKKKFQLHIELISAFSK